MRPNRLCLLYQAMFNATAISPLLNELRNRPDEFSISNNYSTVEHKAGGIRISIRARVVNGKLVIDKVTDVDADYMRLSLNNLELFRLTRAIRAWIRNKRKFLFADKRKKTIEILSKIGRP